MENYTKFTANDWCSFLQIPRATWYRKLKSHAALDEFLEGISSEARYALSEFIQNWRLEKNTKQQVKKAVPITSAASELLTELASKVDELQEAYAELKQDLNARDMHKTYDDIAERLELLEARLDARPNIHGVEGEEHTEQQNTPEDNLVDLPVNHTENNLEWTEADSWGQPMPERTPEPEYPAPYFNLDPPNKKGFFNRLFG